MILSNSFPETKVVKEFYYLMNKDVKILEFSIELEEIILAKEIVHFTDKLPIGFISIMEWLSGREAPKHRVHIRKLLELCGINNLKSYIDVTYALSLNDTFWVKKKESTLEWCKVSLYRNEFNSTIARIAFEGGLHGLEFATTSPEFGTDGAFAKCWTRDYNGEIVLLKGGSTGARNAGLEPYSEFYSSQLSRIICNDSVNYKIIKHHDKLASSCPIFTSENEGYAQAFKLVDKRLDYTELFRYYDSIGSLDDFRRMLVFDAITVNTDRHLGNHGVIFDCDTMEIKRMAPVFDNNQNLLPYAEEEEFNDLDNYLKMKGPRIGTDFIPVARYSLTPEIRSDLVNLKGFKFERDSCLNLEEGRLVRLENLVQKQIELILK